MHWWYHFWTIAMVSFTVSQNKNLINFKELKTLPHTLSMKLSDTFENYTGYLLSHGSYSKFCLSLLRLFMDFFKHICRPSYNIIIHNEPYAHPLLWILWHTVNVTFHSPHLYYGTVYRILLKIKNLFHLLNLPSKHSWLGNSIFEYFLRNCILPSREVWTVEGYQLEFSSLLVSNF